MSAKSHRRLLLFSHESTLSGAPLALVYLAGSLQDRGESVVVATPEPGPIVELLRARGIEVLIDENFLVGPRFEALHRLTSGFELVIANTLASWPVVRAARAGGVRVIWYLHETAVAFELMQKIPEIAPTLSLADLLVTPTQRTARVYQDLARTEVAVIPYGIPTPENVGNPAPEVVTFVALGSYETRKGQDILVAAIEQLPPGTRARARFLMAGRVLDSAFFARLTASAAGLGEITLGAALEHAASLQLLADADVVVCPSRDETMPLAILEAMSLGKAIISADVGGIREWLRDGMNGWLVPPNDSKALARALKDCLQSPDKRAQFGVVAGRTFARHFTLEKFGQGFAALLEGREQSAKDYPGWIALHDTRTNGELIALRRQLRALSRLPRISVLLPVYNPDLALLAEAIESVRAQSYENWELCLADDASTDPAVPDFLQRAAAADARIKATFRSVNGHISAASNSALGLATGDWCALLDQDDALAADAFAWVAQEIARHPQAGLIYSDEDKIDLAGRRSDPFFKTDWSPELFLGQNYINHLGVYRTDLLRALGGFREGFEGSQDYDLALRCLERLQPEQVRHIPRILYHWRAVAGSLAAVADAKPYAKDAARRALADHLRRQGIAGSVEACPENVESHRVRYTLPNELPRVSIVIPTRDRVGLLRRCVESLRAVTNYANFEIVIVDNASSDRVTIEYLAELEAQSAARILRDEGAFNFSRLNNLAVRAATGEILAFLNNDVEITEADWLGEMVSHVTRAEVGAVGARLWYDDGTLQHGGVVVGLGGVAGHAHPRIPRGHPGYFNRALLQKNCSAVTAACMLTRREVFEAVGGFNEQNLPVNFNDIDYCLRVGARGWQVVWTPYANLLHHESASRGHHRSAEEQAQFRREATYMQEMHGAELRRDPFYNPNLSLQLPGYELAFPPRLPAVEEF